MIGRLGISLGVAGLRGHLVDVSPEFIERNKPAMDHIAPGLAHGCRFVPDCVGAIQITHVNEPVNRDRYAAARSVSMDGSLRSTTSSFIRPKAPACRLFL